MPQAYIESDRDATNCYMLFQRLSTKADLINNVVGQNYNLPDSLQGEVSNDLVGICEVITYLENSLERQTLIIFPFFVDERPYLTLLYTVQTIRGRTSSMRRGVVH